MNYTEGLTINTDDVRLTFETFTVTPGDVREVRIIGNANGDILTGIFSADGG